MSYGAPPPSGPYGGSPYGGQPGYGGTMEHPKGTTILILGILGIVVCAICAPIAWVMGNGALKEIDRSPGTYSNRGIVRAGQICGIVGTVLWILVIVFWCWFAFSVAVLLRRAYRKTTSRSTEAVKADTSRPTWPPLHEIELQPAPSPTNGSAPTAPR